MALFIIFAAVLTVLAGAWLVRPLLRRTAPPPSPAVHGQAVYRDQLQELERDVARGLLSPQEEAAARAEIGRRLLAAGRDAKADGRTETARPARILAALVLLVPLAAIALYAWLGRPGAPDRPLLARLEAGETAVGSCGPELEGALAQFGQEVRRDPEHFEAARSLTDGGDNVTLLSEYAQTRVMANDGIVDAEAFDLFRQVLEVEPQNPEARLYIGAALVQFREYDLARQVWEGLLADSPPDAPWTALLREELARLPTGDAPAAADPAAPAAPDTAPATPAPDAPPQ
jgi:cytochrome c-type biogenesis protein CcmH